MTITRKFRGAFAFCASAALFVSSGHLAAQDSSVQSSTAVSQENVDAAEASQQPAEQAGPAGSVGGMGDINLYPRRVTLNRRERIATVGLYNRVIAEGEYEIVVQDMVMTPEGGLVPTNHPAAAATIDRLKPASNMLRWSPRRVRLLGNEAQIVRVMARPRADLADGEYRSHFTVISIPPEEDEGLSIDDAVNGGTSGNGIGVVIRPRFAISIPVIMRVGETTLEVGMDAPSIMESEAGKVIRVNLTRAGTRSAYGDLIFTAQGSDEPIAIAKGIGIYPEIDSRLVDVAIRSDLEPGILQPGTKLIARYVDDDVNPGATLASQVFVVP